MNLYIFIYIFVYIYIVNLGLIYLKNDHRYLFKLFPIYLTVLELLLVVEATYI